MQVQFWTETSIVKYDFIVKLKLQFPLSIIYVWGSAHTNVILAQNSIICDENKEGMIKRV